jgi:adenylate cyclase
VVQYTPGDPEELEKQLLGGPRLYTRGQVAEKAGVSGERARSYWRALGFADVADDEVAFTDADVDALDRVLRLVRHDVVDEELARGVIRAMGHTTARLSEWNVTALFEHLTDEGGLLAQEARYAAVELISENFEDFECLLVYAWRRQLAALAGRAARAPSTDSRAVVLALTVGFADLVSYTRLAQRLKERELAVLVGRFEAIASDVVASGGGRVIKTVGDEVLFVADDPVSGAEIALQLAERIGADEVLPEVRVGVATGTVVARLGDVFGTTVNLASRLTALAAPGTVLVGPGMAHTLEHHPAYVVEDVEVRDVRGLGQLEAGVLRRA